MYLHEGDRTQLSLLVYMHASYRRSSVERFSQTLDPRTARYNVVVTTYHDMASMIDSSSGSGYSSHYGSTSRS